MLLSAKGNIEYERIPQRTHLAVCYTIADLGTQEVTFNGETKKKRQMVFIWETPTALMQDGRPFAISKTYTASLYPGSNLRADLESWRGEGFTEAEEEGFDPVHFLLKPCFIGVVNETKGNGKTYSNVTSILQLPEGVPAPAGINPPVYFSLEAFNQASFDALPQWIQTKIKASPEYLAVLEGRPVGESAGAPTSMHTTKPSTETGTSPMPTPGAIRTEASPAFPPDMPEDDIPF